MLVPWPRWCQTPAIKRSEVEWDVATEAATALDPNDRMVDSVEGGDALVPNPGNQEVTAREGGDGVGGAIRDTAGRETIIVPSQVYLSSRMETDRGEELAVGESDSEGMEESDSKCGHYQ